MKHAEQFAPRFFVRLPWRLEIQSHVTHWLIALRATVSSVSVLGFKVGKPDTKFQLPPFQVRLM
jgi:hypothetical protein